MHKYNPMMRSLTYLDACVSTKEALSDVVRVILAGRVAEAREFAGENLDLPGLEALVNSGGRLKQTNDRECRTYSSSFQTIETGQRSRLVHGCLNPR